MDRDPVPLEVVPGGPVGVGKSVGVAHKPCIKAHPKMPRVKPLDLLVLKHMFLGS